jgi:hypothetical protein
MGQYGETDAQVPSFPAFKPEMFGVTPVEQSADLNQRPQI